MAEKEEPQQHMGEFAKPAAHHHTSLQDVTAPQKKRPRWLVRTLANLLCLVVAGMYVWTTHDILGFLLLYGVATGAVNVRDVIGVSLPKKRLSEPEE